jgi:hypothetical protein
LLRVVALFLTLQLYSRISTKKKTDELVELSGGEGYTQLWSPATPVGISIYKDILNRKNVKPVSLFSTCFRDVDLKHGRDRTFVYQ